MLGEMNTDRRRGILIQRSRVGDSRSQGYARNARTVVRICQVSKANGRL